jgi:hypothetical protein
MCFSLDNKTHPHPTQISGKKTDKRSDPIFFK